MYRKFNKLYHGYIETLDEDDLKLLHWIKQNTIDTYYAYLIPKLSTRVIDKELSAEQAQAYLLALNDIRTLAVKAERFNQRKINNIK